MRALSWAKWWPLPSHSTGAARVLACTARYYPIALDQLPNFQRVLHQRRWALHPSRKPSIGSLSRSRCFRPCALKSALVDGSGKPRSRRTLRFEARTSIHRQGIGSRRSGERLLDLQRIEGLETTRAHVRDSLRFHLRSSKFACHLLAPIFLDAPRSNVIVNMTASNRCSDHLRRSPYRPLRQRRYGRQATIALAPEAAFPDLSVPGHLRAQFLIWICGIDMILSGADIGDGATGAASAAAGAARAAFAAATCFANAGLLVPSKFK